MSKNKRIALSVFVGLVLFIIVSDVSDYIFPLTRFNTDGDSLGSKLLQLLNVLLPLAFNLAIPIFLAELLYKKLPQKK